MGEEKMSLSDQQWEFTKDLSKLLVFIVSHPRVTKCSIGEAWRQQEWQNMLVEKGYSLTKNSRHLVKLAIDLYFWIDGIFIDNKRENIERLADIGAYWESLDKYNKWGGHYKTFCDLNHFERLRK